MKRTVQERKEHAKEAIKLAIAMLASTIERLMWQYNDLTGETGEQESYTVKEVLNE